MGVRQARVTLKNQGGEGRQAVVSGERCRITVGSLNGHVIIVKEEWRGQLDLLVGHWGLAREESPSGLCRAAGQWVIGIKAAQLEHGVSGLGRTPIPRVTDVVYLEPWLQRTGCVYLVV